MSAALGEFGQFTAAASFLLISLDLLLPIIGQNPNPDPDKLTPF